MVNSDYLESANVDTQANGPQKAYLVGGKNAIAIMKLQNTKLPVMSDKIRNILECSCTIRRLNPTTTRDTDIISLLELAWIATNTYVYMYDPYKDLKFWHPLQTRTGEHKE
ncbi:hypothetical protein RF11_14604 [Thelohanellus kitauei]|uniref:Uncharacterized protein n=1 Tax=Thelohanellus kitauei TaxID=669202 RepID=A0A0C2MBP4_THEKT|nr:hypothetical protein RF11_14604 [Thelohanellus kitauei]